MTDWRQNLEVDDDALLAMLQATRRIAVLGFKLDPDQAAYRIPDYMRAHGYEIVAVNPRHAGASAWGEPVRASLAELGSPVEMVNLFRAPAWIPGHVEEILALPVPPRACWMQLGIRHPAAAERLARAGIQVVQDRCLMVEHRRLLGARGPRPA